MVLPNASGPPGLFQLNSAPPPVAPQQQTITLSLAELKQVSVFPFHTVVKSHTFLNSCPSFASWKM